MYKFFIFALIYGLTNFVYGISEFYQMMPHKIYRDVYDYDLNIGVKDALTKKCVRNDCIVLQYQSFTQEGYLLTELRGYINNRCKDITHCKKLTEHTFEYITDNNQQVTQVVIRNNKQTGYYQKSITDYNKNGQPTRIESTMYESGTQKNALISISGTIGPSGKSSDANYEYRSKQIEKLDWINDSYKYKNCNTKKENCNYIHKKLRYFQFRDGRFVNQYLVKDNNELEKEVSYYYNKSGQISEKMTYSNEFNTTKTITIDQKNDTNSNDEQVEKSTEPFVSKYLYYTNGALKEIIYSDGFYRHYKDYQFDQCNNWIERTTEIYSNNAAYTEITRRDLIYYDDHDCK